MRLLVLGFGVFLISWFVVFPTAAKSPLALRLTVASEPPTLDWNLATDNVSYKILNNLMEGLTQYNERLEPVPALARAWDVSPDGRRYTFHLRDDVQWSDGVPLTAEHFVASWKRLLSPATGAEYAYFLYDIAGAKAFNAGTLRDFSQVGIRARDPQTLVVDLNHAAVYFPAIVTFMVTFPVRPDVVEKFGPRWTDPRNIVTLGPFRLSAWRHEYKLVLSRNPRFYGEPKPLLEEIHIFVINEKTTALALYETGALDVVELPPIAIPSYAGKPEHRREPELRGYYYGFNTAAAPFTDVRVRRAFSLAIDRSEFPKILRGGELPATSWVPPGMFGHNAAIGLAYDPIRARRLLAEAGFPGGRGFPRVTAAFNTDPTNRLVAENLQGQWRRELNVDVVLDNQEWKVYLKKLQHEPPALFRMGWGADFPDPDNFMNLFTSFSGNNHTRWKNPDYDRLIADGARAADPKQRQRLYDEAQRLLCETDAPIMPLFIVSDNYLVKPRVKNLRFNPLGFVYLKTVKLDS